MFRKNKHSIKCIARVVHACVPSFLPLTTHVYAFSLIQFLTIYKKLAMRIDSMMNLMSTSLSYFEHFCLRLSFWASAYIFVRLSMWLVRTGMKRRFRICATRVRHYSLHGSFCVCACECGLCALYS